MLWFVIIGFFGAFGVLCALWVVLGGWLTGNSGSRVVIHPAPGHAALAARRCLWLRNLGLVKAERMIVLSGPAEQESLSGQYPGIEFLTPEQYIHQLNEEREKLDGT